MRLLTTALMAQAAIALLLSHLPDPCTAKVFDWELGTLPASLSQLQKPLHLTEPLEPGKDNFDIVLDPLSSTRRTNGASLMSVDTSIDAAAPPSRKRQRVLRSLYPAHSFARSKDRHASFEATPLSIEAVTGPRPRYIRLEYQMLFQPGFEWVKGGKLPGILAGNEEDGCGGGSGNAGCSGGGSAENCFSTRMMWREGGEGEVYLYAAKSVYFPKQKKRSENCKRRLLEEGRSMEEVEERRKVDEARIPEEGDEFWEEALEAAALERADEEEDEGYPGANPDFNPLTRRDTTFRSKRALDDSCLKGMRIKISPGAKNQCNPTYGISIGRGGAFKFKSGQWHNITQIVRINSASASSEGKKDGYLSVYLDGNSVIQAQDLILLKNGYKPKGGKEEDHQVRFMFSSFFGGATKDYASPKDQWIGWKGFKMTASDANLWE